MIHVRHTTQNQEEHVSYFHIDGDNDDGLTVGYMYATVCGHGDEWRL